jgi:ABC-type sugar transport system ATPase subunit
VQLLASVIAQYVGMGSYTIQLNPMVDINDTMVVLKNGEVVGMHPNKSAADNQVQELIQEWQRYSDNGSPCSAPRLAVLSFDGWMRLSNEFVF